ncbi:hypothetical protein JWV37_10945 [Sulfurospirillum sp. T05]|uniref:Uncharacterized protein n=1 Tax=Sulfurospirillum tamanense TaxID=2813362 RepID=A0ABS2WUL8_9BACT|nr:hypothetical protein [Sulfurospirillum tamanensis]MBN2965300.1 hypothetical protein [Sulfurospirillum tamanensis]
MFNKNDSLQLKEFVALEEKQYYLSTIEMEVRHSWQKDHERICVYETMVFAAPQGEIDYHSSLYHCRYRTKEEAIAGHQRVREELPRIIFTCKSCSNKLGN